MGEAKPAKKDEKAPEKKVEPVKAAEQQKESNRQFQTIIGIGGAIAVVIAGLIIQEIYSRFVIIPTKERTFVNVTELDYGNGIRVFSTPDGIIEFLYASNRSLAARLQVENTEKQILKDFDFLQFQDGDGTNVGKLQYQYNNLIVTIRYLVQAEQLTLIFDAAGFNQHRQNSKHEILITTQNSSQVESITVVDGTQEDITIFTQHQLSGNYEESNKLHNEALEKYHEEFEKIYKLKEKQLPTFYQEMGRSALLEVIKSITYHNTTNLVGHENGFFNSENDLVTYLQNGHNAIDSQIFSLIVASSFDVKGVELALESWLNTINELQELANYVKDEAYHVDKIQQPLLFQLIKVLVKNPAYKNLLIKLYPKLEFIAEETYKHSTHFYWIGTSSDIFGLKSKTGTKSQSLELNCLLEDMMETMVDLAKLAGRSFDLYEKQVEHLRKERAQFWNSEKSEFGDLQQKKLVKSTSPFAPLILGVLEADSTELATLINSIENSEFYTKMGIQESSTSGSSIAANYLLLGSLQKYSNKSGPNQHKAHVLFSILKNNIISHVARNFKSQKSLYSYYDNEGNPVAGKGSNNGALILPIMAEMFV